MLRLLPLALLVLSLAACDSTEDDAPVDPVGASQTFEVRYAVEGTYTGEGCAIEYRNAERSLVSLEKQVLPWEVIERVTVTDQGDLSVFNSSLKSTCEDPDREGKATVSIFISGALRATQTTTGPGELAQVQFSLRI